MSFLSPVFALSQRVGLGQDGSRPYHLCYGPGLRSLLQTEMVKRRTKVCWGGP